MEMARLKQKKAGVFLFVLIYLLPCSSFGDDLELPPEIPDADTVYAFKQYTQAFDRYESNLLHDGKKKFSKAWEDLKKSYLKNDVKSSAEQLDQLQKAAASYKNNLENYPDAPNRPFVLLNLAQINFLIGTNLTTKDESSSIFAKNEAITILDEIRKTYEDFPYREQALYLRAMILDSLNKEEAALEAWRILADQASRSIYGFYARVAVGDYFFSKDIASEALPAYQKAEAILETIEVDDREYEALRIYYRLAWAAYRAADLDVALKASAQLLEPRSTLKSPADRKKIQQDAIEIIGDSLYETNSRLRTEQILKRREISAFSPRIGLRVLSRFFANNISDEVVSIGMFLLEEFPLSSVLPDILQIIALSQKKMAQDLEQIKTLEKLAMLLPRQSLWRARFKEDRSATVEMEEKAEKAAMIVANWYYERGLSSGSMPAFLAASAQFDQLIEFSPNGENANKYRLRRAHCYFFTEDYNKASELYRELQIKYKVDVETLEIASYQLVLSNERIWRKAFSLENDPDKMTNSKVRSSLDELERSVDDFAARFPGQSRSIDLLLLAANANRDLGNFDRASSYWQRVLISQTGAAQRSIAIKGVILSKLKTGSPGEVIELVQKFLKIEDWQKLGNNTANELRGILSSAAFDEAKRLNEIGKVFEAGILMTSIAEEFSLIPQRDRIWRDGCYMLGIAGEWSLAQKSGEAYLKSGLKENRADMMYIVARAKEYQLRLIDAARDYYDLGVKYPSHPRAKSSLERAEKLASAENSVRLAADARMALADQKKGALNSVEDYEEVTRILERSGDIKGAEIAAKKLLMAAKTVFEKLKAEVLQTRLSYEAGQEQKALVNMKAISKRVEREKQRLNIEDYQALNAEVQFFLGEESRRQFEDFKLMNQSGKLSDKISQKSKYFEDLVFYYDKSAAANIPDWSAKARYLLAVSAEAFAEEIASVPARTNETLSFKAQARYQATIQRLKTLGRRYHSANALALSKDPARYKDNEWIKKSIMRISNQILDRDATKHKEQVPVALPETFSSMWSL